MAHYEIIFEDGDHSIFNGGEEEVLRFAKNHHQRAKSGLPGGPAGTNHRAVRIVRILEYSQHPVDLTPDAFTADELNEAIKASADENGVVSVAQLQSLARRPAILNSSPHESNFAAKESKELDSALWEGDE